MSQTKNNVAADVIGNANVNTINKLEYNIISTYIQYSKFCNLLKCRSGKCFSGYLEHSVMIFFWLQRADGHPAVHETTIPIKKIK